MNKEFETIAMKIKKRKIINTIVLVLVTFGISTSLFERKTNNIL